MEGQRLESKMPDDTQKDRQTEGARQQRATREGCRADLPSLLVILNKRILWCHDFCGIMYCGYQTTKGWSVRKGFRWSECDRMQGGKMRAPKPFGGPVAKWR